MFLSAIDKISLRNKLIILFASAVLLYANTFGHLYSDDDWRTAGENELVQKGFGALKEIFTTRWTSSRDEYNKPYRFEYRPITKALFAIEYGIFGENPNLSHVINVLLYGLLACLLLRLLILFSLDEKIAFLACLLFVFHPIHTEAVANLKNREVLLAAVFGSLSLIQGLQWQSDKKHIRLLWVFLLFGLAALSKIDSIAFVFMGFTGLWIVKKDIRSGFMVASAMTLGFMVFRVTPELFLPDSYRPYYYWENPLFFDKSLLMRFTVSFNSMMYLLGKLIFPHPLIFYYGYNYVPAGTEGIALAIFSLLFHIALFALIPWQWSKRPVLSWILLCYFLFVFPFSNLVFTVTGIIADRYMFYPSLAFTMAIAYMFVSLPEFLKRAEKARREMTLKAAGPFLIFMLLLFALKTITRNEDWYDYLSLYSSGFPYMEKSAKGNSMLAAYLRPKMDETRNDAEYKSYQEQIIACLERSVKVYPAIEGVHNNLGFLYLQKNELDKAEIEFRTEMKFHPEDPVSHFNMGFLYYRKNLIDSSIIWYRAGIKQKPQEIDAREDMLNIFINRGRTADAFSIINEINHFDTLNTKGNISFSNYLMKIGDTASAAPFVLTAFQNGAKSPRVAAAIERYYARIGKPDSAILFK